MEWPDPPRRTERLEPACEFCGARLSGQRDGEWRQVLGWVQNRAGGGAHGVTKQEPTGRLACDGCMSLVRRGHDPRSAPEQGSLLG